MRHPDDVVYSVALSAEEQDFVTHMQAQTGVQGPSDILRLGLWHLAKHLDVPIGGETFAPRARRTRRQSA